MGNSIKRLTLLAAAHFAILGAAWAQQTVAVNVGAGPCGRFYVDGQRYDKAATFLWPMYTTHTLVAADSYTINYDKQCQIGAWSFSDAEGLHSLVGRTQYVYVGGPATYTLASQYLYRVAIGMNHGMSMPPFDCGGRGYVIVNGTCYDRDSYAWFAPGTLIQASGNPPPNWVLLGWGSNGPTNPSPAISFTLDGPIVLRPVWRWAAHATVTTDPPGLKVLVDQTPVSTPVTLDWAPGSEHTLSPVTPQRTKTGAPIAFFAWSDEAPENRIVTAPDSGRTVSFTAKYAKGATAGFTTAPSGLKLVIDGRSNWPNYNFVWAIGSKHTISAPLDQTDAAGRKYLYQKWTQGGTPDQEYTVLPTGTQPMMRAIYEPLGQLVIQSTSADARILVDGTSCAVPCVVDRRAGTEVKISPPETIAISESERLIFQGWTDGGPAERVWKATAEAVQLTARYGSGYHLNAISDPADGATFRFSPPSADGFFAPNAEVAVTAEPKPGFKFRNWDGDIQDPLSPTVRVRLAGPTTILAMLNSVPYLETVRNAASEDTPEGIVAPGSVIAITGRHLASVSEEGPASPLSQSIAGVMVEVKGRYLPLFSVSPDQITAQLNSDFSEGTYAAIVHQDGEPDTSAKFTVQRDAPGLFARSEDDRKYAVALHADGKSVTADNPAKRGETITLLGTGFGPYRPVPADGAVVPEQPKNLQYVVTDTVEIRTGDQKVLKPASAQAIKGSIGMTAIAVKLPSDLAAGQIELRAAVKDPADPSGKTWKESNKVLLTLK